MTRLLRLLPTAALGALLAAPTLGLASAGASAAVDACVPLDLDDSAAVVERADGVDDVFVGRVDRAVRAGTAGGEGRVGQPPPGSGTGSVAPSPAASTAPPPGGQDLVITHRVTVVMTLRGDLQQGQKATVVFAPPKAGSPRVLTARGTYLFFTRDVGDDLRAAFCEGAAELPNGLTADRQRELQEALDEEAAPDRTGALRRPDDVADQPPRLSRVLAPGAAISLGGLLGLFLISRIARARG